jgi:flagellar FliJ protein
MSVPFKLEPVLKHRKILEDQARQRLAEAQANHAAHQQETDRQRTDLERIQEQLRRQRDSGINAVELRLFDQSLQRRRLQLEDRYRQAAQLEQAVAHCSEDLAEAGRNRRLLEKLKEKQEQAHRQKLQRLELNQLDETAITQFRKKE